MNIHVLLEATTLSLATEKKLQASTEAVAEKILPITDNAPRIDTPRREKLDIAQKLNSLKIVFFEIYHRAVRWVSSR